MTDRTCEHATFTVERTYNASPSRVFHAFADPAHKSQWFGGGTDLNHSMDFRVGGREHLAGSVPDGPAYTFDVLYQDIVEDQRIVYTYDMSLDGQRISVSVATIELAADGERTRLTVTEQGVFLDGLDQPAMRAQGTEELMDKLGTTL
jgi:uncharacterized protein YndB with AHSA1/START domain